MMCLYSISIDKNRKSPWGSTYAKKFSKRRIRVFFFLLSVKKSSKWKKSDSPAVSQDSH